MRSIRFSHIAPGAIPHAHNLFLQIAVDLGIPGLIAWLAIFLVVIVLSWKLYRYGRIHQNVQSAALGIGLLCSQIALVMHGMTDAVTWGMVRPAPFGLGDLGAGCRWLVCLHPDG